MAKKMYRCYRPTCLQDKRGMFYAEQGKCPRCGLDEKDQRLGHKIQRLAIIHFDPPSDFPGVGMGYRACDPKKQIAVTLESDEYGRKKAPTHVATGNPEVVTCPECIATQAYQDALAVVNAQSDEDHENTLTAAALARHEEVKRIGEPLELVK